MATNCRYQGHYFVTMKRRKSPGRYRATTEPLPIVLPANNLLRAVLCLVPFAALSMLMTYPIAGGIIAVASVLALVYHFNDEEVRKRVFGGATLSLEHTKSDYLIVDFHLAERQAIIDATLTLRCQERRAENPHEIVVDYRPWKTLFRQSYEVIDHLLPEQTQDNRYRVHLPRPPRSLPTTDLRNSDHLRWTLTLTHRPPYWLPLRVSWPITVEQR